LGPTMSFRIFRICPSSRRTSFEGLSSGCDSLQRQEQTTLSGGTEPGESVTFVEALGAVIDGVHHHGVDGDFFADSQGPFQGVGQQDSAYALFAGDAMLMLIEGRQQPLVEANRLAERVDKGLGILRIKPHDLMLLNGFLSGWRLFDYASRHLILSIFGLWAHIGPDDEFPDIQDMPVEPEDSF